MLTHTKSKARSKVRQVLDKDRDFILWLYDARCLMCGRPTKVIHEIQPISHGNSSLHWTNRVPLCAYPYSGDHHTWAHNNMKVSIPRLQEKRLEYLKRLYPLNYELGEMENVLELVKAVQFDTVSGMDNDKDLSKEPKDKENLSG